MAPPRRAAPVALPESLRTQIEGSVETTLRKRLGIKPTDPMPAELKTLISKEVAASAPVLQTKVATEVQGAFSELAQSRTLDKFKTNLGFAKTGIVAIAAASEVDEILKKRAELLAKKRSALQTAGFTADEAMQIVLADIAAKA
jgi:hypothetical protein